MRLIVRFLVIAVAFWLVAAYVPGIVVRGSWTSYLVIAAIFAAINLVVRPVLKLLSFPLLLLTLGLFLIVINAVLFGLTALLTDRLDVEGIAPAVIGSLVVSAVTWIGDNVLGLDRD
jgi:putative membrane protein